MQPGAQASGSVYVSTDSGSDSQNIHQTAANALFEPLLVPSHELEPHATAHAVTSARQRPVCINLDGEDLHVDKTHLPDPPAIHFSDDIPALFREWHASQLLVIAGRGIPIKHWDKLYKKRNGIAETDAWHAIKVEWGNWKFLVEEHDQFPSENAFWAEYSSEEGERLSYQQILDKLQDHRGSTDDADYYAAMRYFGNDLDRADAQGAFRYRKSGKPMIYTKRGKVAQKWRKLLAEDAEIRANWDAMQAERSPAEYSRV
ncbi:hypothetical protein DAEQUDRAFT_755239 [Daedalea quercina L-15889]|uniref:Uncharacterized protein n=1 Tax=Daedalea quercina L-15889 TaxID=1314783 RepID=A0A165SSK0_9APHY|nr:hypothetical protein DAEQUDRAFT_755239 [Daedalea quercina L-15889]